MHIVCFNSIKVQLERETIPLLFRASRFQFHKGSIRTFTLCACKCSWSEFQFHKGSIRTCALYPQSALNPRFNSIKVQLEPDFVSKTAVANVSFNSIKVQLELNLFDVVRGNVLFQFHKGSIRTHYDKDCNILVHNGVWWFIGQGFVLEKCRYIILWFHLLCDNLNTNVCNNMSKNSVYG